CDWLLGRSIDRITVTQCEPWTPLLSTRRHRRASISARVDSRLGGGHTLGIGRSTESGERMEPVRASKESGTATAILDAAYDCLLADGYAGLSARQVGARGGVPHP